MRSEVTEQHKRIAKAIVREGKPVARAMLENGVTPRQAKKGWRRIAHIKAQRVAIEKEMKKWADETAKILQVASPEVRTGMIRSRLMLNIVRGEDKALSWRG